MKTIQVAFYKEGDQWVAQGLNLEISTFGSSLEGAQAAIREAVELYFENDPGVEVPEIDSVTLGRVDVQVA